MCNRKFLLIVLFLLFQLKAFSAVFIVTSNVDSGPGTLRDALTQAAANGTTGTDYINFNLPDVSEAGRTMTLLTQLPDVTGNIIIDGTTQPGTKFGVSDAKVALFYNTNVNAKLSGLFINNANNVSVFGLYIKNLADVSKANLIQFWKAIEIEGGSNIQIGAAGKGNVAVGFQYPLATNTAVDNNGGLYEFTTGLTIKDNIFSIDADGETLLANIDYGLDLGELIGNINIGGTIAEGNTFAKGLNIGQTNSNSQLATIIISNNKVGVDFQAKTSIPKATGISVVCDYPDGTDVVTIEDNVIASQGLYGAIDIENLGQQVTIIRNYIGTNKTLQPTFPMEPYGISIFSVDPAVKIGDNNPADANYITNCKPVAVLPTSDVMVNKNSFFCTVNEYPMHIGNSFEGERPYPVINILQNSANSIGGTATPNSTIELFYSDKCLSCSPQTYFASVTADENGNWAYNGALSGTVIASATINGNTSEFTKTNIDVSKLKIVNACDANGLGSILGAVANNASTITWFDSNGKPVGYKSDLINVPPGIYTLTIQNGACSATTTPYEIKTVFKINDNKIAKLNPSCGNANGTITGIKITNNTQGQTSLSWKDVSGSEVGKAADLTNVPAGIYTLYITDVNGGCTTTYGPVTLTNTTGPNIDQSQQQIQSTNCGQTTGSIINIQVSGGAGNYQYVWWNDQEITVGTNKDLTGQPAGIYKLQVTDGGACGPIYSSYITIPETNTVTLNETQATIQNTGCGMSNGSITKIIANGATAYKWVDQNGKTVGTTPDLQNVAAGTYTLTASNGNCTATSKPYAIAPSAVTTYPGYNFTTTNACYLQSDGSISVTTDGLVKTARWVNSQGQPEGTGSTLTNVPAGMYQLYLTDAQGCETLYKQYTVDQYPEFTIETTAQVTDEQCGLKNGAIGNTTVTGGAPPYTYTWLDENKATIGSGNSIANLPAGNYTLNVTDTRCGNAFISYTVNGSTEDLPPPSVSNLQLCSSGNALLSVNDPSASTTYRLYDDAASIQPIAEQKGGRFNINVSVNRSYYITEINGTCESSRARVNVTVGLSALSIANTFTPNGDGINDYWVIDHIENYPNALVQVFNRYGQKVFESRGYANPFDGTYNGKPLSSGVYYYIINLSTNCSFISGSLTILR